MKKLIFVSFICFSGLIFGQSNYNTAIGLRAGETSGLTIKHFIGSSAALEGIFGAWRYGFSGTLLYEKYVPAFNTSGLNWYFGGGGHVSIENRYYYRYYDPKNQYYVNYYSNGGVGLGIDGILGLEYKIPAAPIAFSLDVKPFVEINSRSGGVYTSLDPSIGIKVAF